MHCFTVQLNLLWLIYKKIEILNVSCLLIIKVTTTKMCQKYTELSAARRVGVIAFATAKICHPKQADEAKKHLDQCTAALNAHVAQCKDTQCLLIRTMWTPEAHEAHKDQCEKDECPCRLVHTMCIQGVQQQQRHSAPHPVPNHPARETCAHSYEAR